MNKSFSFDECVQYCGFDNLPEGLKQYYDAYVEDAQTLLIERDFLMRIFERFSIPVDQQQLILNSVQEVEQDVILFHFTKFLVVDMCSARKRCETDDYKRLTPTCMSELSELYSFILLLACVVPSSKMLEERGIPIEYYSNIPYNPMEKQFSKLVLNGDSEVSDFSWDMNFYTCSIFFFDRFFFIPFRFEDNLSVYRNYETNKVLALQHAGVEFRRDGQFDGINEVFDHEGKFTSKWLESHNEITANPVNPMGYVINKTITIMKSEWQLVLEKGDILLGFHIPEGPGYIPERVKSSMKLAIDFYNTYFPELKFKGFGSESWLYDSRLSLVLDHEKSNIVKVQRQFYLYPTHVGDAMMRLQAFGDPKTEPLKSEPKSSLQKAIVEYMKTGARLNNLSMIVLNEEVDLVGNTPYISVEDIDDYRKIVDSHLQ